MSSGYYDPFKEFGYNIDTLSLSMVPMQSRVLEVGPGSGRLSSYLQKKLDCSIVGVDINKQLTKPTRQYVKKLIIGDIEEISIQKKLDREKKFDIIFLSAVIGSLENPQDFLKNCKRWLKPQGKIVITFANIAHFSSRIELLFGSFNYQQEGLHSLQHLRFFTLSSAWNLVRHAGYKIESYGLDVVGFPRVEKVLFFIPRPWFRLFYSIVPGLFTYQFVLCLRSIE